VAPEGAPEAPTVSRRHQAGAPSARGLLLTVLGELVLPGDGTAWTSAVLAVFARLGIAEKATRQALMRTSQAGWLKSEHDGRRARWVLTPAARRMLTDGAERIYSFGQPADWDRRWVVVSVRIPESDRRARHVVRTRLTWAGFGALAAGLWISPHSRRASEAERVLRDAGVGDEANVFVAERTGLGDVKTMVATAWDLPSVEAAYETSRQSFAATPHTTSSSGRSSWCTPGGGSRRSTRPCPVSCCRPGGPAHGPRNCSPSAISRGSRVRAGSGSASIPPADRLPP
jgi:phenylacetic acid degradation operon negative regulatory protein